MQLANSLQTGAKAPYALESFASTLTGKAVIVVSASLFVAVCAHLIVPLGFTPVPLTLSDFAVVLVGLLCGPEMAFAALALYLAEGAAGLPVFSPAGPGGIAQIVGFTGGYLMAYPFAAALAGSLARTLKSLPRYASGTIAATAASVVIMASGAAWLGLYLHHATALTFNLGVLPFLPGQVIKIVAAAGIFAALSATTSRWRRA